MSEFNDDQNKEVIETYVDTNQEIDPIKKKGFSIASLVLGITGIVPGCCCTYIGIILGILAVVFGILFLRENKNLVDGKGLAIAGIVLGAIAVVLNIVLIIIGVAFYTTNWNEYNQYFDKFMQ